MFYSKKYEKFYENEDAMLLATIYAEKLEDAKLIKYCFTEAVEELLPGIVVNKRIYCIVFNNYSGTKKMTHTVYCIEKPLNKEYFSIEKRINYLLQRKAYSEYGMAYNRALIEHFKKYNTFEKLKNNPFKFDQTERREYFS